MLRLILISFILCGFFQASAQQLYIPRNVQKAIQKGTRSLDGKPGKNYWQNHARYAISLQVNPPHRTVTGTETIIYINLSPDTLKSLTFKLILNSHAPGAVRQYPASPNYLTSGIHVDKYGENNIAKIWESGSGETNRRMGLTKGLAPHDSVKVSLDWHYDISVESGREGAIDSNTFFLAYFYPRVAVYDDYNGWDRTPFTEAQEFYNDFNDYTFEVTAPKNYLVWATGDLLNAGEVLQPAYAGRLTESFSTDSVVHVANLNEVKSKSVTRQKDQLTWKWKAAYVSDVAIAISNHYVWDASSVVVDDATHRRASVQAAFDNSSKDFHSMVAFGRHSLHWLSRNWPGVPYPYQKTTIVQGYADMEYPMMVNDNTQEDPNFARFVAEHEIAHTWFPFYMGTNETRYGFMDEGWATAFEYLIGTADQGQETADNLFKMFRVAYWIKDPSAEQDIPIITPSNILSGSALGNNEYGKAALGYLAIKELLGDDLFKTCLHGFIDRWHGKHPTPWDMFYSFNNLSGKDLNWFWSSWFFSNGYIDLALQKVESNSKGLTLTIDNVGGYPAPFTIEVLYTDDTKERIHRTPEIWMTNQKQANVKIPTKKKVKSVNIDGGIFMDATEKDNAYQVQVK